MFDSLGVRILFYFFPRSIIEEIPPKRGVVFDLIETIVFLCSLGGASMEARKKEASTDVPLVVHVLVDVYGIDSAWVKREESVKV